jgi:hypothetical protein
MLVENRVVMLVENRVVMLVENRPVMLVGFRSKMRSRPTSIISIPPRAIPRNNASNYSL